MASSEERFFVGSDDSGHKYLVPTSKRAEWLAWEAQVAAYDWLDNPDENIPDDVPAYAKRIDGGTLTFTDPKILQG